MSAADAGQAQRAALSKVEKQCSTATGLRCDVVTLYSGQINNLCKYKKHTDVRLVFAPEFDAAFFGGDPDNFTDPRYDLDVTFFRVYENGKPAHLDNSLQWSSTGVKDGDLIFVSGHCWMKAKPNLDLKAPLNSLSTADTIEANSGSPTVNEKGEVVGSGGYHLRRQHSFAAVELRIQRCTRTQCFCDSRGIQEALRKIYGATALADELTGIKADAAKAGK